MAEKKTPIEQVTDLLAEMTARAFEAEQRRDAADKSATEWYERFRSKDKELKEANKKIAELEDDLKRAVEYIERLTVPTETALDIAKMEGAKNNG